MEQELKEFIEETKLNIPSHFGRITAPTIKNGDNSEPNPLYYQKNVFGFKKTLEDRIDKTSNVSSILNNYVSSLTNLFQDIVLIFVHIQNNNSRDVDTSLKNYFNSLNEVELYNRDILNQQLIVDNDELVRAINFMSTGLKEMVLYFERFSRIDLNRTLLKDSFSESLSYFENSLDELGNRNNQNFYDLKNFFNPDLVNNPELLVNYLLNEFSDFNGKKLINVFNILLEKKVILYGENDGLKIYNAISKQFNKIGSYSNFMKNFPKDLNETINLIFLDSDKERLRSDIKLINNKLKESKLISL